MEIHVLPIFRLNAPARAQLMISIHLPGAICNDKGVANYLSTKPDFLDSFF